MHEFDEILPSTNPSWKQEMVFWSWSQSVSARNPSTAKPQIGWITPCFDWSPRHPWRKIEDDLDGDMYHCIWDSNLTDDVQNTSENKGAHCALTKFGKTLRNEPQHPHHLPRHTRSRRVQTLLPPNQLDVIANDSHIGRSFVQTSSPVPLFGDCQSAQSEFVIQVRIIGPPPVGITKSIPFAN